MGIGVAVPGLTRAGEGVVSYAPHLGWKDAPIAALLVEETGLPVSAANDASLGAWPEYLFGGGRGCLDLVYLNGGASGVIGGVLLLNGVAGYAGEPGHTLVNTDGVDCHCGSTGCLETEFSLERLQRLVDLPGSDIEQLEAVLRADTSATVRAEVDRQVDYLAVTLRNTVNVFHPERIILGGFLVTLLELAPERPVNRVSGGALHGPPEIVRILPAVLGSGLLMIGAAELAFAGLLADPQGFFVHPGMLRPVDRRRGERQQP